MFLKYLSYKPEGVTKEQYQLWKQHPCTLELKHELALAYFDQINSDLPESVDKSIPLMHQREGAKKTLDIMLYWEPSSIRNLQNREGLDDEN